MTDHRRLDQGDDQLDLDRIRDALGVEPSQSAATSDAGVSHPELPELPRKAPADRTLETFGDGNRTAPVEEVPLQASQGLSRERRRAAVDFEDEVGGIIVGALADLPSPAEETPTPRSARVGGPSTARHPPVGGPSTARHPPVGGPSTTRHNRVFPTSAPRSAPSALTTIALSSVAGILVFAFLFLRSIVSYRGVAYMGVDSGDLAGTIVEMFRDTIVLAQLEVLGVHLLLGLATGIGVALLLLVTRGFTGRPRGRLVTFLLALAGVALTHLLVLGHAMALQPQIFADAWYSRGGAAGAFQRFFSDLWPIWVTPALGLLATVYASVGGAFLIVRGRQGARRLLAALPLLTAAAMITAALWSPAPAIPPAATDRLNVVILCVDSLRPDALAKGTEGGFARLTGEGIVFENGWTSMPRTLPAWVSYLTGLRPYGHGIRHMFPGEAVMAQVDRTVIHAFRDAGYQTAVFSDFAGDIFNRMDFGFETVEAPTFALDSNVRLLSWKLHLHMVAWLRTFGVQDLIPNVRAWERMPIAAAVTDDLLGWLSARDPGRPFVATVFWSNPHFPFSAPYPFLRRHAVEGYDGPNRYLKNDMEPTADAAEKAQVDALYMASVDAVDREVARVVEALDDAGLLDRTVILLLADHGENMYEYDFGVTHGDHLYGQASHRIPFVVRLPGGDGGQAARTARGIDIAPTLEALAGLEPTRGMHGVPLFDGPARIGDESPAVIPEDAPAPVYSETGLVFTHYDTDRLRDAYLNFERSLRLLDVTPHGWTIFFKPSYRKDFLLSKHRMWLRWPHKLLYVPTRQGPRWELFDLEADPGETENLFSEDDPLSRRLRDELVTTLEAADDVRLEDGYLIPR